MKDRRTVDELSIEELEEILRVRKREARLERLRQLGKEGGASGFDPLAPKPVEPRQPSLPTDHRRFQDAGATAQYRARALDEPPAVEEEKPRRQPRRIRWDWLRDKSLLVIEVVVLAGLVLVLLGSLVTLREINEEAGQAQQLPTLTPTPAIQIQVVLPAGHTPPDSPGGPAPEEIPAHLRDLVSAITPLPIPTPGPEQAIRIQISAIGVDAPVGYIDHAGLLADPIPAPVAGSRAGPERSRRESVEFTPFQTEDGARAALEAKDIQAYYIVAADYAETSQIDLVYLKEPGRNATRQFYDFIQINLLSDQPPDIARRAALISDNVIVRSLDGSRQLPGGGPTFGIIMPLLISIAFLVLLVMSSGYLMQAVADEKENRAMEVLITSISPTQFIGGKVLGIVAISFTQLVAWAAVTVLGIIVARNAGIEWFQNLDLDWNIIWATVAVGIPAYVLAAALMTAIGAIVTSS